jgi:hypothetical protein
MPVSGRTYIFIGLGTGILIFLIGLVWGQDITDWSKEQQNQAEFHGYSWAKTIVFEPVEFVFDPERRPVGAIIAGLAWPLVPVWLILILIAVLIIPGSDVANDVDINLP